MCLFSAKTWLAYLRNFSVQKSVCSFFLSSIAFLQKEDDLTIWSLLNELQLLICCLVIVSSESKVCENEITQIERSKPCASCFIQNLHLRLSNNGRVCMCASGWLFFLTMFVEIMTLSLLLQLFQLKWQ